MKATGRPAILVVDDTPDTLRLLGNLPYLETVSVATLRVEAEANSGEFASGCLGET